MFNLKVAYVTDPLVYWNIHPSYKASFRPDFTPDQLKEVTEAAESNPFPLFDETSLEVFETEQAMAHVDEIIDKAVYRFREQNVFINSKDDLVLVSAEH